jgi:hypothetical protein
MKVSMAEGMLAAAVVVASAMRLLAGPGGTPGRAVADDFRVAVPLLIVLGIGGFEPEEDR